MVPTHATKAGIRYRYYASLPLLNGESKTASVGSVSRIPATGIEDIIVKSLNEHLTAQKEKPSSSPAQVRDRQVILEHVARIDVHENHLTVRLRPDDGEETADGRSLSIPWHKPPSRKSRQILVPHGVAPNEVRPTRIERRARLVNAIARARRWLDEIVSGSVTDVQQIAARQKCSVRQVNMTISLAFLAPDLVKAAVEGRLPRGVGVGAASRCPRRVAPAISGPRTESRMIADGGLFASHYKSLVLTNRSTLRKNKTGLRQALKRFVTFIMTGRSQMPYRVDQIDPGKTAMIVVDMQNDFVAEGAALRSEQAAAMVPRLAATLKFCRENGIRVVYTAHVHRRDGSDMGMYDDLYPPIADRSCLVDGTKGVEIFGDLAPAPGEHVIKKHRYSGFFATDLDIVLREWGIKTVIISGTTTENCCHATARDAMFNNYKVVFLSDVTGTFDYPDVGQGSLSAEEVHRSTLTVLAFSTAHVMTADEFKSRVIVEANPAANKAA